MLRRLTLAAAIVAALIPMSACVNDAPPQPAASVPVVAIKPMTVEERRQLIAPNFQAEVPVPSGEVVRGEAQGELAWDYELIVAAPPAAVASWYKESFIGRDWQLVDESAPSQGAITLAMTKNAAQTRVTITPEGGDTSRVKVVLGVGAPVLQTQ